MVEADYLRAYRSKGVSLQRLRPFIAQCRDGLDVHDVLAAFRHEDKLRPLKIA